MTATPTVRSHDQPLEWGKYQQDIDAAHAQMERDDEEAVVPPSEEHLRETVAHELEHITWVTKQLSKHLYNQYLATGDHTWQTAWFAVRAHVEEIENRAAGIRSGRLDPADRPNTMRD